MSESQNTSPSPLRAFFGGFGSGALSGLAMMGIVALLSPILAPASAGIIATFMASAPLMSLAAGLFGGGIAAKNALFDQRSQTAPTAPVEPVPVTAQTPTVEAPTQPKVAQQPETPAPSAKNWVASTASAQSQDNIQKIIENGSLSDKARADSIYAERLAGANAERNH